jgi:hypothetical protein
MCSILHFQQLALCKLRTGEGCHCMPCCLGSLTVVDDRTSAQDRKITHRHERTLASSTPVTTHTLVVNTPQHCSCNRANSTFETNYPQLSPASCRADCSGNTLSMHMSSATTEAYSSARRAMHAAPQSTTLTWQDCVSFVTRDLQGCCPVSLRQPERYAYDHSPAQYHMLWHNLQMCRPGMHAVPCQLTTIESCR